LIKKIKIQAYREEMRFPTKPFKKVLKASPLQPILGLIPEALPTKEEEKNKFLSFELKARAGQPAGSTTYKKYVRVFEEGTPHQWIELMKDLQEIWTQNTINGPTDRTATIRALFKGESLTAFETALEDVRVNPEEDEDQPLPLTVEIIDKALALVAHSVFPHRALETQRLWMNRGMRKPAELSARKTASAISKINSCLPLFPGGTSESKFSEPQLVGLLEWALPQAWRNKFDLDGYIPTQGTRAKLILECEAIERSEITKKDGNDNNNNNNNNNKKNQKPKFGKTGGTPRNREGRDNGFFCKNCGPNRSHVTANCYFLKNAQRNEAGQPQNGEAKKPGRPFSRRTFRKEVNTLACKAAKKKALGMYKAALKRKQDKESGKKVAFKKTEDEDSSTSEDSVSIINLEKKIPRKNKEVPTKIIVKKPKKEGKKEEWDVDMELEQSFLNKMNNIQIEIEKDEEDYEMVESDEDVISLPEGYTCDI
jgi:hypothetical protein